MVKKEKTNGKHRNHHQGAGWRLSDFFGLRNPIVSKLKAEWNEIRGEMRIPTVNDINLLKRRVEDLEKRIRRQHQAT